ncbi:MAG: hypothetical protein AAFN70_15350, partial [Planctomycetota bacterium]
IDSNESGNQYLDALGDLGTTGGTVITTESLYNSADAPDNEAANGGSSGDGSADGSGAQNSSSSSELADDGEGDDAEYSDQSSDVALPLLKRETTWSITNEQANNDGVWQRTQIYTGTSILSVIDTDLSDSYSPTGGGTETITYTLTVTGDEFGQSGFTLTTDVVSWLQVTTTSTWDETDDASGMTYSGGGTWTDTYIADFETTVSTISGSTPLLVDGFTQFITVGGGIYGRSDDLNNISGTFYDNANSKLIYDVRADSASLRQIHSASSGFSGGGSYGRRLTGGQNDGPDGDPDGNPDENGSTTPEDSGATSSGDTAPSGNLAAVTDSETADDDTPDVDSSGANSSNADDGAASDDDIIIRGSMTEYADVSWSVDQTTTFGYLDNGDAVLTGGTANWTDFFSVGYTFFGSAPINDSFSETDDAGITTTATTTGGITESG